MSEIKITAENNKNRIEAGLVIADVPVVRKVKGVLLVAGGGLAVVTGSFATVCGLPLGIALAGLGGYGVARGMSNLGK